MHLVTLLQTPSSNLQLQTEFVRSSLSNMCFYWPCCPSICGRGLVTLLLLVIGVPMPQRCFFLDNQLTMGVRPPISQEFCFRLYLTFLAFLSASAYYHLQTRASISFNASLLTNSHHLYRYMLQLFTTFTNNLLQIPSLSSLNSTNNISSSTFSRSQTPNPRQRSLLLPQSHLIITSPMTGFLQNDWSPRHPSHISQKHHWICQFELLDYVQY